MAIKSDSFVDKIYDAYINEDYKYGDDNLNPKHEIKKSSFEDTNEQVDKILEQVKLKVKEISEKYSDNSFSLPSVEANFGGGGKNPDMPTSLKLALARGGSINKNLVDIPSMEDDPDPLTFQIEITLSKILMSINADNEFNPDTKGDVTNPEADGLALFDVDCNGTINPITGKVDEGGGSTGGDNDSNSSGDSAGQGGKDGSNSSSSGGGGGGGDDDKGGDDSTDSKSDSTDEQQAEAVDEALQEAEKAVAEQKANAKACAMADLKLLKALLAILKIIKAIKKIIDPVIGILMEVIQIVVLAAQAWNNPTTIGEIIARITQKLMAILMQIVAMLLQMLWNLLGLDCQSAQLKNLVDQIRATLAGIDTLFEEVDKTAISMSNQVKQVKDAYSEAEAAIKEAIEGSSWDAMKKKLGLTEEDLNKAAMDIYADNFSKGALTKNLSGAIESTDAYSQVMANINSINKLKKQADETVDKILKAGDADSEVRKLASQFTDISAL